MGILRNKNLKMRLFLFLFYFSFLVSAQLTHTTFKMPKSTNETSGLEFFGDYLITHNDSGDKPKLYLLTQEGQKVMEIELNQLKNKDWEDITADDKYYYIADTGNKFGTRENLIIYILEQNFIPKAEIYISYEAQINFSKQPKSEFDAEGLAVVGKDLVLFSKNRKTMKSEIYTFPKAAGKYVLTPRAVIDSNALITAADYSHKEDLMVLTGYNFKGEQFLYTLKNFRKNGYDNINLQRYNININPAQIEAIKIIDDSNFWLTSESEDKNNPRLFRFNLKVE